MSALPDTPASTSHVRPALRLGATDLPSGRTLVMGILNVTPDSFSDGGRYLRPEQAIEHGLRLAEEGADILDVGGESTRPGAAPVSPKEERLRILPVVEALTRDTGCPISIDTRHPQVAEAALDAGAVLLNDVTGLSDPGMLRVIERTRAAVVVMHMKGTPRTMASEAVYEDLLSEVRAHLMHRARIAEEAGAASVLIDPGLGFAKDTGHNLTILRHLDAFTSLGYPLLVGPSRKRFIGELTGAPVTDRLAGTLAVVVHCAMAGVPVVRVHDVREARQAIAVAEALRSP